MDELNRKKWVMVNRLWEMNLPLEFIRIATGHSSCNSLKRHMTVIRGSLGQDFFKPRQRGFRPEFDIANVLRKVKGVKI